MAATNVQAFSGDVEISGETVLGTATYRKRRDWNRDALAYVYLGNVRTNTTTGIRLDVSLNNAGSGYQMYQFQITLRGNDADHSGGQLVYSVQGTKNDATLRSIDIGYVYVGSGGTYEYQLWLKDPATDTTGNMDAYLNCQGYYNFDTGISDVAHGGAAPTNFNSGVVGLLVDSAGIVGIGTDVPSSGILDVAGTLRVGTDSTSLINIGRSGNVADYRLGYIYHGGTNMQILNQEEGDLQFGTNNGNKMIIEDSGNVSVDTSTLYVDAVGNKVGIGMTEPGQALEVNGNIRVDNGTQYPLIMHASHSLVYNAQRYFPNISANSDNYIGRFSVYASPAEFNITDSGTGLGSGSRYIMAKMYGSTIPPVVEGINMSKFSSYRFLWQAVNASEYDVWFRPNRDGYYTVYVRSQSYTLPTEPSSPTLVDVLYGPVIENYDSSPGVTIGKYRRLNLSSQLEVAGNVVVKRHITLCSNGDESTTTNLIPSNLGSANTSYLSFVRGGYFSGTAVDTTNGSSGLLFSTTSSGKNLQWGMYQHYVKPFNGFSDAVGIEWGYVDIVADRTSVSYASSTPTFVPKMILKRNSGFLGIGTRSPSIQVHAFTSYANSAGLIVAEGSHRNDTNARQRLEGLAAPSMIMPLPNQSNADDVVMYWKGSSSGEYRVIIDGSTFFTGQHAGVPENYDLKSNVSTYAGLIVCPTDTGYKSYNHSTGVTHVGQRAIEINECLPYIKLSEKAYDKSVFGVLSNAPNNSPCDECGNLEVDDDPNLKFGNTLRDRVRINSLGEGAIWVTDLNGNLDNGDYITSSNVSGYGMKQDSEFLANYTVAKITMSCDFNPNTIPVKRHKKVFKTNKYWVKYGAYDEVEYEVYEDTPEDQRKMQTIQEFFNTETNEPPISLAYYNTLDESNAATYTSEFRDQYLTRSKDKRPYEKPPPEKMRKDFEVITVDEYVDDLDENGVVILEDVPGETELEYKIRYLDMDGNIVDESNASCKAAFVGCTYHCG